MKWRFGTGGGISGTPLISPDGTIYCASKDGNIYAVTPSGTRIFRNP
jgi:outer membrane protein assembly factor BamB